MNALVLESEADVAALVRGMRTVAVVGIKGETQADEPRTPSRRCSRARAAR